MQNQQDPRFAARTSSALFSRPEVRRRRWPAHCHAPIGIFLILLGDAVCLPRAVALYVHGGVRDVQPARDLGMGERLVEQALRPRRANPVSAPGPDGMPLQGEHVEKFLESAGGEQAGEAEVRPPCDEAYGSRR